MNIELYPKTLRGTINVPSSLTQTIINIILSSLCSTSTTIINPNFSEETFLTIDALKKFGVKFKKNADKLIIIPPKEWKEPNEAIECGINDSLIFLLMALTAYKVGKVSFHCSPEVIKQIENNNSDSSTLNISFLKTNGTINIMKVEKLNKIILSDNTLPQTILGAILFVVSTESDFEITINSLNNQNYVKLMLDILKSFNIQTNYHISENSQTIIFDKCTPTSPNIIKLEGDWAIGSFLCIMGLSNERLIINNLSIDSFQEEKEIINLLKSTNNNLSIGSNTITIEKSNSMSKNYDLTSFPSLNIQLLTLSCISDGTSIFDNYHLLTSYYKKKLLSTIDILKKLHADITLTEENIIINGKNTLEGGTLENIKNYKHFLMLLSILNNCVHPITITNSNMLSLIDQSFIMEMKQLGLQIIEEI